MTLNLVYLLYTLESYIFQKSDRYQSNVKVKTKLILIIILLSIKNIFL